MASVLIRPPVPDDAAEWFDFVVEQQARTYQGIVRPDFAQAQCAFRDSWVPGLAQDFADPGTARRLIARQEGQVVGVASIVDAPDDWEVGAGLVPAPASHCLDRLYLHPDFQGQGLGSTLLANIDDGHDLYLWLIDGNAPAQGFYRRRGFVDEPEHFPTSESWGEVPMHRMVRRAA
ncbi:MAG: GNAT family N-acetyltransferase [Propionicimonas sp.]|uniref:GNAT family N-acetyltransferase n=1 Tax=Propionicimonas sp. TaxID=1955623 RepID=UPI002B20DBC1|nr:GNAT family N-acetyltransferase [Propionicimonas sp.]MEA4943528.1 GNAT family N-acetyltransferase [Propionicimonas sp.]MEA5055567.1 GNAT family N-acetyltransferase [Propionicimonas sp.]MEA5117747.1 GNAT family N-acetyltransferase [Propionicimonas sp.]